MFDHNTITVTGGNTWPSYGFSLQPSFLYSATRVTVENNLLTNGLVNVAPTDIGYYVRNTNGTGFPAGVNLGWRYTPCRADLNLDANVDIVLQDTTTNVGVMFMTNGVPGNPVNLTPSYATSPWQIVGTGDIDRDGRTDLFFQNSANLDIGYWLMKDTCLTGSGLLGVASNPGGTWRVVATGDFNNDNKADLLLQDASFNLGIWYLNGTSFQSGTYTTPGNTGTNWVAVGTGDFDNDGSDDILFQYNGNPYDGRLLVWFMNGATNTTTAFLNPDGTAQPNMRVAATGVFGTSGGSPAWNTGILFQDRTSTNAVLQMWYMSGTNRVATNNFAAPSGSYKVVGPR
jgi:hypothetical protein